MEANSNKLGLNLFSQIVFCGVILRNLVGIITYIIRFSSGFYEVVPIVWGIIVSVGIIIALIAVLNLKKWGISAFFVLQTTNVLVLSILRDDFIAHAFVGLVMCVVFGLLLMLKNNGISGWEVFRIKYPKSEIDSLCVDAEKDNSRSVDCSNFINKYDKEETIFADNYVVVSVFVVCIFVILYIIIRLNMVV